MLKTEQIKRAYRKGLLTDTEYVTALYEANYGLYNFKK